MPEISRFYGIVVMMYYNEHPPSHFHAEYGGQEMVVNIETLAVIAGKLPRRATGLVMEWAALHQADLRNAWNQARNMEPPGRVDPLP